MNEVSTHPGEANQMRNLPLPGWAPEFSTMIASATAKAAAEAVINSLTARAPIYWSVPTGNTIFDRKFALHSIPTKYGQ